MPDHLDIRNFKGFKKLKVEGLQQVNLITGKNNTGKTSLLEAVMLWDFRHHPGPAVQLRGDSWPLENNKAYLLDCLLAFFYDRNWIEPIEINDAVFEILGIDETDILQFDRGGNPDLIRPPKWSEKDVKKRDRVFFQLVPSWIDDQVVLDQFWDTIALTAKEDDVLEFMRLIDPKIKRISSLERVGPRRLFILREGEDRPIPLNRLGEGVSRLLALITALIKSENGILLIDEVGSGLHYSIQPQVWQYIFQYAAKYNVQVFATTHSRDCVEAFTAVANQSDTSGSLVRLYTDPKGDIKSETFEPETIQAALSLEQEFR